METRVARATRCPRAVLANSIGSALRLHPSCSTAGCFVVTSCRITTRRRRRAGAAILFSTAKLSARLSGNVRVQEMPPSVFRVLLVSSVLIAIIAGTIDFIVPNAVPEELAQAQKKYDESLATSNSIAFTLLITLAGILSVGSTVGLYMFKSWARPLAILATAFGLFMFGVFEANVYSGWAMALNEMASMLWGSVIAAAYFSPLKDRFLSNAL